MAQIDRALWYQAVTISYFDNDHLIIKLSISYGALNPIYNCYMLHISAM